jgi:HlyD family secretion protein
MTQLAPSNEQGSGQRNHALPESQPPQKSRPRRFWLLIPAGLLIAAVGFGIRTWLFQPDNDTLALSGRIEGYETNLGAKTGGELSLLWCERAIASRLDR